MTNQDVQKLRESFRYSHSTGDLFRKTSKGFVKKRPSVSSNGYDRVGFGGKRYGAHRVIWALVTGSWPAFDIDHKNGVRTDNRLANLRHVDRSTNLENIREAKSNNKSSGVLGVNISTKGLITSRIQVKGESVYLGIFDTVELAHAAYVEAKRTLHEGATI